MILAGLIGSLASGGVSPSLAWSSIDYSSVDEGQQNTVYLNLTNWNGSQIYWFLVDTGGSQLSSGQVTAATDVLSPGTGNSSQSFNFTFNNDATADGTLTYYIRIENEAGDLLIPRQGPFTCNDTSFAIGQYIFNGTPTSWATTNATSPTYGAYTYPDESSGLLHTLTGSQYLMSGNIGNNNVLNINLWFYPTANNKIIMGEMGQLAENSTWHYSMLDIDSTNHLRGRLWEFVGVTSTGTVTLNAWNHAYLYYNSVNDSIGLSLNNETAVTTDTGDRHPSDTSETYLGIGIVDNQNMSSSARYQGKFDTPVIDATLTGSNYTATKAKYIPPLSLQFSQLSSSRLYAAASNDWNLGTTWTIEFWVNAPRASDGVGGPQSGIWGLFNQAGWSSTNSIVVALSGGCLKFLSISDQANADVSFTEPTPGVWTHVAIVNNSGTQRVWYNGAEQTKVAGNFGTASYTNSTDPLYIGSLSPANGSPFDGKLALVRISNAAKYTANFTPIVTYGVEADTKLLLALETTLVDSKSHAITNTGVTTSTNVPTTFAPLSLLFGGDASPDYLTVAASSDWNLGTTWTIEWWSKAAGVSSSNPYTIMAQGYGGGSYFDIIYISGNLVVKNNITLCAEPTPNQWTHVALSSNNGALTVYYNGVQQYSQQADYSLSNAGQSLFVGRRVDFQHFNGRLALVRISNTAKYATAFVPTITYGVEADTKLLLGKAVPLIDPKGHAITNTSVTLSTDFPN